MSIKNSRKNQSITEFKKINNLFALKLFSLSFKVLKSIFNGFRPSHQLSAKLRTIILPLLRVILEYFAAR